MLKIIAFGLGVTIICNFMQSQQFELAHLVRILGGTIMLIFIFTQMDPILTLFQDLASRAHIPLDMLSIILKTIGIAYLGQFGSTLCTDMGEGSIAKSIDTIAKLSIVACGLPVFLGLLELIADLIA